MRCDREYRKKLRRAYGIDDQFETIDEIRELSDAVKNEDKWVQKYYKRKKNDNWNRLRYRQSRYPINYQHQACNCAYENMLVLKKKRDDFMDTKLFSLDGLIKGYRLYKYHKK